MYHTVEEHRWVFYTCGHKSWVYSVGGVFKRHFLQKVLVGVKVLQREFWQNGINSHVPLSFSFGGFFRMMFVDMQQKDHSLL
jgi:hypothetical protein